MNVDVDTVLCDSYCGDHLIFCENWGGRKKNETSWKARSVKQCGSLLTMNWIGVTLLHCPLQWRHNDRNGVSHHQPYDCLLTRLFRRHIKKLSVTGICKGNSPVTGEFPTQRASNAENVWWRHHAMAHIWPINGALVLYLTRKWPSGGIYLHVEAGTHISPHFRPRSKFMQFTWIMKTLWRGNAFRIS